MMGYVEQFDTLSPRDTAREAVEFSAGLRLPRETPPDVMANWVDQVLRMLELIPLQNTLVGSPETGGMSFEQKKRLSIAVELVANPAILFLDEPTSGLDSRAAQVVIRCIRRVAESGRSIVCTIHQPSVSIFTAFDSLLLLRRGGRTVFNGELGENCEHLIDYFQGAPGVAPIHLHQNPATWMLEVIGAGTGSADVLTTDFHEFYKQSVLCGVNSAKVDLLCSDTSDLVEDAEGDESAPCRVMPVFHCKVAPTQYCTSQFNATYFDQCKYVMRRAVLSYWRSPSYNFIRMITSIIIALIFASTFADQNYDTDVDVMSRCAVMFITILFCGVVVMMSVQPVMFGERPSFYREQFSDLYDVRVYAAATGLVE
ncbi:PDR1, partial [Symbiodinium microadriaticum]